MRFQVIYTKAEIEAAGGAAGVISQLGWRVGSGATGLTDYTVKLGHTTSSAVGSNFISGLTQVYNTSTYAPTSGYNMLTLSPTFTWNGTQNIVVEVCYTRSNTSSSGGTEYSFSGTSGQAVYRSGTNPCTISSSTYSNYSTVPQIRFVMPLAAQSCAAPTNLTNTTSTATTASFSWTNGSPTVGVAYAVTTTNVAPTGSGTNVTGTSVTVNTGLSAGNSYYFWLRNRCTGSSNSEWISIPFSTACTV